MMLVTRDNEMRAAGRSEGKILGTVETMRDDGKNDKDIISRLMSKYELSEKEAEGYVLAHGDSLISARNRLTRTEKCLQNPGDQPPGFLCL